MKVAKTKEETKNRNIIVGPSAISAGITQNIDSLDSLKRYYFEQFQPGNIIYAPYSELEKVLVPHLFHFSGNRGGYEKATPINVRTVSRIANNFLEEATEVITIGVIRSELYKEMYAGKNYDKSKEVDYNGEKIIFVICGGHNRFEAFDAVNKPFNLLIRFINEEIFLDAYRYIDNRTNHKPHEFLTMKFVKISKHLDDIIGNKLDNYPENLLYKHLSVLSGVLYALGKNEKDIIDELTHCDFDLMSATEAGRAIMETGCSNATIGRRRKHYKKIFSQCEVPIHIIDSALKKCREKFMHNYIADFEIEKEDKALVQEAFEKYIHLIERFENEYSVKKTETAEFNRMPILSRQGNKCVLYNRPPFLNIYMYDYIFGNRILGNMDEDELLERMRIAFDELWYQARITNTYNLPKNKAEAFYCRVIYAITTAKRRKK